MMSQLIQVILDSDTDEWFGAVKQQVITWTNVDPDPCYHMVPIGHNELTVPSFHIVW